MCWGWGAVNGANAGPWGCGTYWEESDHCRCVLEVNIWPWLLFVCVLLLATIWADRKLTPTLTDNADWLLALSLTTSPAQEQGKWCHRGEHNTRMHSYLAPWSSGKHFDTLWHYQLHPWTENSSAWGTHPAEARVSKFSAGQTPPQEAASTVINLEFSLFSWSWDWIVSLIFTGSLDLKHA